MPILGGREFGVVGGVHLLEVLVDVGQRFFAEVAAFGDGPFVVLLQEDCADEADHRGIVGQDPDHVRSALDLVVDSLQRVRRGDLAPVRFGERCVSDDVGFCCGEDLSGPSEPFGEHRDHGMKLGAGGVCVGLCVDRAH